MFAEFPEVLLMRAASFIDALLEFFSEGLVLTIVVEQLWCLA